MPVCVKGWIVKHTKLVVFRKREFITKETLNNLIQTERTNLYKLTGWKYQFLYVDRLEVPVCIS